MTRGALSVAAFFFAIGTSVFAQTGTPSQIWQQAIAAHNRYDYQSAERLFREYARQAEAALGPNARGTLRAQSAHARTLHSLGRFSDAIPIFERLIATKSRSRELNDGSLTGDMSELALIYQSTGRLDRSIDLYHKVIRRLEADPQTNTKSIIAAKGNLALILKDLGRYEEAEILLWDVLAQSRAFHGPAASMTLAASTRLAEILVETGRADEAVIRLETVLADMPSAPDVTRNTVYFTELKLAHALSWAGRFDESVLVAQKAFRKIDRDNPILDDVVIQASEELAFIAFRAKDYARAKAILEQLVKRFTAKPLPTRSLLSAHYYLAWTLRELGELDAALHHAAEAVSIAVTMPESGLSSRTGAATLLAELKLLLGDPDAALTAARHALAWHRDAQRSNVTAADHVRAATFRDMGTVARILVQSAWSAGESTDRPNPAVQQRALRSEAFKAAQNIQNSAAEAFLRGSARIAASRVGLSALVAEIDSAQATRRALDGSVASLTTVIDDTHAEISTLRGETDRKLQRALQRLSQAFPAYFELLNPEAVSEHELQANLLSKDEGLVLILPGRGDEQGLVWAVSQDRAAWAEIPLSGKALSYKIGRLRALLGGEAGTRAPQVAGGGQRPSGFRDFDRALAHELYLALFGAPEIRAVLGDRPDWIIAPQGPLLSLPFAALVTSPPKGADGESEALRATSWLGLKRSLTVIPSVPTLRSLRQAGHQSPADLPFFGLGDPAFRGAPDANRSPLAETLFRGAVGNTEAVRGLSRLPHTRSEVEIMAATLGGRSGDILLGAKANETQLARVSDSGRLARAQVVLLATHGLMSGSFEGLAEPALALSPPENGPRLIDAVGDLPLTAAVRQGARLDDGLLTASEVARLRLSADWVILSACDTAAGSGAGAEGLTGLARAFFFAGARALLVSHWPVKDDIAARLTTEAVHLSASRGIPRARALQIAMRRLVADKSRPENAHPAIWAPFHLVGVEG